MEQEEICLILSRLDELEARIAELEAKKRTTFKPPTPDEVYTKALELVVKAGMKHQQVWPNERITILCKNFYLHYKSNGWMVGKVKMKSWESALQRWMNTEHQKSKSHGQQAKPTVTDYVAQRLGGIFGETGS
jgi:hypothetical protein